MRVRLSDDGCRAYVASAGGFAVYQLRPFSCLFRADLGGSTGLCEPLGASSLVAITGGKEIPPAFSSRTLCLWNMAAEPAGRAVTEQRFDSPVLAVALNALRLAVALSERILLYDTASLAQLATLETCHNPEGIMALSPDPSACYLVYPKTEDKGHLLVYDAAAVSVKSLVQAHQSAVSAVAISPCGTRLATASGKGTVVRIFSIPTGSLLQSLRRGSTIAKITSLAFFSLPASTYDDAMKRESFGVGSSGAADGGSDAAALADAAAGVVAARAGAHGHMQPSFLTVASTTGTVHVFRVRDGPRLPSVPMAGADGELLNGGASMPSAGGAAGAAAGANSGGAAMERGRSSSGNASSTAESVLSSMGLEGERAFAVVRLRTEASSGSGEGADAASDPPVGACITPLFYRVESPVALPAPRPPRSGGSTPVPSSPSTAGAASRGGAAPQLSGVSIGRPALQRERSHNDVGVPSSSAESSPMGGRRPPRGAAATAAAVAAAVATAARTVDEDYELVAMPSPSAAAGRMAHNHGVAVAVPAGGGAGVAAAGTSGGATGLASRHAGGPPGVPPPVSTADEEIVHRAIRAQTVPAPYFLTVVTRAGWVRQYELDIQSGGTCSLRAEHALL